MMRLYRKRLHGAFCLLLSTMVLLAGCGVEDQETSQVAEQEQITQEPPREAVDWSEPQLTAAQEASDGTQWRLREFYDDWITYPETYDMKFPSFYSGPQGEFLACTQYVSDMEDGIFRNMWDCLDYFDTGTGETFHARIDSAVYEEWGLPKTTNLVKADVMGDKLVACYLCGWENVGTPSKSLFCSLILYHMEDGLQKSLDLLPALTEAGMVDCIESSSEENVLCDSDGCCYIVFPNKILVISETGELLLAADSNMSDNASLSYLCKTPEGLPLFVCSDLGRRSNSYWIYDHDAGEMRSLGETDYKSQTYGCVNTYGDLFYIMEKNVVRWNTQTGTLEKIFDCQANSICSHPGEKNMTIREDGDLVILDPMTENKCIYVLSPTPPEQERVITLVGAAYGTRLEQTAAALFSMKNPGVSIDFSENTDIDNLMNQIVAGDAPDMMIVPAETMQILYEKGVLADLSDAIPPELREQVFECVWQAGTIDGKLTGLTTSIAADTILVSKDVWAQDTWSLEDILTLAENAPKDSLKGLIPIPSGYNDPASLLYWLALQDIDSSLLDRENGVCHFDCDTFRKLLEYCKNTPYLEPENNSYEDSPSVKAVLEGEYLAYPCTSRMGYFPSFSDQMALFPEEYHCVGVPTERESGNLVITGHFLVVNRNSENMDLILKFLPTLYGEEIERKYPDNCLRRDVLRSQVFIPEWDSRPVFSMGESTYKILSTKPDGTAYVEEYIAFMDSCILPPIKDAWVASIVLEEVEPYFAGDKDMDTVIGIIQNRVQTYLNENG